MYIGYLENTLRYITSNTIAAARNIVNNGWLQRQGNTTDSTGNPATGSRHTLLAAIQRADKVRLFSSAKGGWFKVSNYDGYANRKAIDALAVDFAARNPQKFTSGPVLGIESLNNKATGKQVVLDFLSFAATRVTPAGGVNLIGLVVKRA